MSCNVQTDPHTATGKSHVVYSVFVFFQLFIDTKRMIIRINSGNDKSTDIIKSRMNAVTCQIQTLDSDVVSLFMGI